METLNGRIKSLFCVGLTIWCFWIDGLMDVFDLADCIVFRSGDGLVRDVAVFVLVLVSDLLIEHVFIELMLAVSLCLGSLVLVESGHFIGLIK